MQLEHSLTETGKLTPVQRRFLNALLVSRSVREAAGQAAIGERTAHRWLREPAFQAELQRLQDETLQQAVRVAVQMLTDALQTLAGVMNDQSVTPAVRVSAAKAILESGIRFTEVVTLAERIAELEARLGGVR